MKRTLSILFSVLVALCLLAMPGLTATAHDLPQWKQVNTVPPNKTMMNVTALGEFNGNLYAGTTHWIGVDLVDINSAVYQSKDGKNWKKVTEDGFGDPVHNTTIYKMLEFRDKLYVGTGDFAGNGTAQLWRTSNGSKWEAVETGGFGDPANHLLGNLIAYRGMLYATVENSTMGIQFYRSGNGNPGSWKKVATIFDDPKYAGQGSTGLIAFNDVLYMATEGPVIAVWRSKDGSTWTPVTTDGFGDAGNNGMGSFGIYQDQLYVGTGKIGEAATGSQVWRTRDGKNWSKVMDGGFGDVNNFKVEALIAYTGDFYALTSNFTTGDEVWRTSDGKKWEQVNQDGFRPGCMIGDEEHCNWGIHNGTATLIYKNNLYTGTWNVYGGEIWKLDGKR